MSRIGRQPIPVPSGVKIELLDHHVTVSGPKGTLSRSFSEPISIEQQDGQLLVTRPNDDAEVRALHGLTRSLVANMVTGVTTGFTRSLQLTGVGYRAQLIGKNLVLQVGYSHPVEVAPPENVSFTIDQVQAQRGSESRVHVQGIDKAAVGEIASRIRNVRPPEPYLGKGIRYTDEVIRRKAGKAGKAGGKKK
ncbi:MAG TPA: 50S ribosomal protein L6 [Chloroflexota bacterium]|jgi:large subunit ribosomal protein L6|nr:50S ribosomal protein L6 [Chloroflexota bacterium]